MSTSPLTRSCRDERRRALARSAKVNGLDYLEVSDDGRTVTAFFLGKAPEKVGRGQVRISGPPGARPIELDREPVIHRNPELDEDDCVEIRLAAPGSRGTYTLCLDDAGLDPLLSCLDVRFDLLCPDDLDCAAPVTCPEPVAAEPDLDYLAKDYDSFRRLLFERLSLLIPDWTERHVPDVGVTLVELLAYVGDQLSYQQDAVATEAYLRTARHRISVRRHARLVDYAVHEGCNARVLVCLGTEADQTLDLSDVRFLAELDPRRPLAPGTPEPSGVVFEPVIESSPTIDVRRAHTTIGFYAWGDRQCCLPKGATGATLVDAWVGEPDDAGDRQRALDLHAGDLLFLEEVKGPRTGNSADADVSHRHPVRLVSVEGDVDWLIDPPDGQPVVRVTWDEEDALPFPLCLSSLDHACALVTDVSVARGNVLLADHGRTVDQVLGDVEPAETRRVCCGEDRPAERRDEPAPFLAPALEQAPLSFTEPIDIPPRPAARLMAQDPRRSVASLHVLQRGPQLPEDGIDWKVTPDLLGSSPYDRDVVVEVDDEQRAHLRFGDGRHGRAPESRTSFTATYRVGNGPAGNVGAEAVAVAIHRTSSGTSDPLPVTVRNPLPAAGGTAAETLDVVRDLAPVAFRSTLQRAVTATDYAALAGRADVSGSSVQRASAVLRWTGSWYEALTTVDARGDDPASDLLLSTVASGLARYRRIGHDLVVGPAAQVALLVELSVCVRPGFQSAHVRAALLDAFGDHRLTSGRLGYFHPDNLSFGDPVTISGLTAAAHAVPGVESVQVTRLERLWEGDQGEVAAGVLRLGPDELARLDNDASRPQNGVLLLNLRGGR